MNEKWPWYPSAAELSPKTGPPLNEKLKNLPKKELEKKLKTDNQRTWYPSGEKFLVNQLKTAIRGSEPITLLVNCPLTPLKKP